MHEITLNGAKLDTFDAYKDNRIALGGLQADNELRVHAEMPYSHTGEGLHRFVDPVDQRVYLYSQFEVPDARRVYTTFEQPDLKSVFTFNVTAPAHWTVVSNAPTPEPEDLGDGKGLWRFPTTERMSTYITALVAGEYHRVDDVYDGKHGTIELGHFCRQSLAEHLDHEALNKITKQGFAFFEDAFDFPYPFGKYDQLYVPEYNMGAMENAGAVTYRDEYLPRSRQTYSFYEQRANTVLHEMAHMWFGDLVTMKWWDDLWLNESFAEWASHHAMVQATEFTEAWTGFTNARKNWAYRQDQLPSTHPIAADNHDLEAVEVNFDGITYAKGASTLKQLVAWVGIDEFLVGLRDYFKAHAFSNSEFSDLLGSLEKTSGRELDSWAHEWLQTSGVNTLAPQFEVGEDGAYTSFGVAQTAAPEFPTLRRHRIGVGLYDLDGDHLVRRTSLEIDVQGDLTDVPELVGQRQPDLLLLNDGDLTYAKIRLDERSLATAVESIDKVDDSLARALLWGAAWDMTRDAEMTATDFVRLVLRGIGAETDSTAVERFPTYAQLVVNYYSDPTHRAELSAVVGAGRPRPAPVGRPRLRPPALLRAELRLGGALGRGPRPGRRPSRRDHHARRAHGRHRPALDAAHLPGPRRPCRGGPHRRGARPRQHHLRPGAGGAGAHGATHRGGQGRGVARRDRARRRRERDDAPDRLRLPDGRSGGAARAVPREVPRDGRDRLGGEGHPAGLDGAGVHVPPAAHLRRDPGPARRVARGFRGEPCGQALRARGARRHGTRARCPGQGRRHELSAPPPRTARGPGPVVPHLRLSRGDGRASLALARAQCPARAQGDAHHGI